MLFLVASNVLLCCVQGVTFGHGALFTVYGTSSGSSQIDYRAETEDALRRLDHLLDTTGGVNKKLLTQVRSNSLDWNQAAHMVKATQFASSLMRAGTDMARWQRSIVDG